MDDCRRYDRDGSEGMVVKGRDEVGAENENACGSGETSLFTYIKYLLWKFFLIMKNVEW